MILRQRPYQAISALAAKANLVVHTNFGKAIFAAMISEVLARPEAADRYDLVFVFDRPAGSGPFTAFTQVSQRLLAGDSTALIP